METYRFHKGSTPLLISVPHAGTHVPAAIADHMTPAGRAVPDTDWHVDDLYEFAADLGASTLVATHSRYVVDLNRPPDNENLYPGQDTPGLVPTDTFHKDLIYEDGHAPTEAEITERVSRYWRPYHDRLARTLEELRATHGVALLWDAHSIRSFVPRFVSEPLPDLSFGTGNGTACANRFADAVMETAAESSYSHVLNGRFRGGYTTRHYGRPDRDIHAMQLELSQVTYMDEDETNAFRPDLADQIRPVLRACVERFVAMAREN